jgi:large conductance mechanosensitive channel
VAGSRARSGAPFVTTFKMLPIAQTQGHEDNKGISTKYEQGRFVSGFKKFLLRGNLIELAVAFVIGAAFTAIVQSLVKDLITPLIAAIGGQPDFSAMYFTVHKSKFMYGDFINSLISFLIIAAVVYFLIVAPFAKLLSHLQRNKEATERDCPECLNEIPVAATRCMYCTATVTPTTPSA